MHIAAVLGIMCAGLAGALLGDNAFQVLLGQALWIAAYKAGCFWIDRQTKVESR